MKQNQNKPIIRIKGLNKKYKKNKALNNVEFEIKEGICFGLIGPNGAGKSTLMKILSNILKDYDGQIFYKDDLIKKSPEQLKNDLGYVPQKINLYPEISSYDNLEYFGRVSGLKKEKLAQKIDEVLELVGLKDRKKEPLKNLSGGMLRRINIGVALMSSPNIIIMDEPTVGIDPHSRNYIYDIIKNLKEEGKTIIYSSHHMEEIENLCEEVALIDKGEVIEIGEVKDIIKKHSEATIYIEGEEIKYDDLKEFGHVYKEKGGFEIKTKNEIDTLQKLTEKLKTNKKQINQLELIKPNLETVFFTLTGTNLRD